MTRKFHGVDKSELPSVEPHAVRWAQRVVFNEYDYTKWHYTDNGNFTACGCVILLAVATCLPETDEVDRVDCKRCLGSV